MSENNRIEYKQELTDSLEKEVIAFLNARQGGFIFIGIDNQGKPIGLKYADSDQLKIKDRLKHNISPSCLGLFDVISETKNNLETIKIIIASGPEKPYFFKKFGMTEKGTFMRIGSASEPMPQKNIDELFSKRIRNSLGKIKSNNQNLNFEQLKIYYQTTGINLNDKFANNLEFLNSDNDFNYVAFLLADNNTTSIKFAKYSGTTRADLIENNEYGFCSLIKATKQVLDKFALENTTNTKITAKERQDHKLWNEIALREVIVNAFVHNDYTNEITPKFEIFADRIEITSAGSLPESLSQNEFFEGYSVPRNKELMRVFKDLELVEQLGSGIPRVLEIYPKECFKFTDNFLRMTFPFNNNEVIIGGSISGSIGGSIGGSINKLTERQNQILDLIKHNPKVSYRAIASQLNINESAIKKHLIILKTRKQIERIDGTRGYWKINLKK